MNELAVELNDILSSTPAGAFLSEAGKRLYFPKGIVAQSDEAKQKAKLYNATVGLATKNSIPYHFSDIMGYFRPDSLKPQEIFSYAPGGGDKELRAIWKEEMIKKNPLLKDKKFSLPLVTGGLSHAISILSMLFLDADEELICPDLFWDNYELIFQEKQGGKMVYFPFYNEEGGFNVEGMKSALMNAKGNKARILLNFPNNPTGYTPSKEEMKRIAAAIVEVAETGRKVMVISDDAYYGLFYEDETEKQSLFAYLCDAHENIFAIKGDAATKEDMVWGFRIGFVTYASKAFDDAALDALVKKTLGAIRCTVSNCDRPGQSLLLHAIKEGKHYEDDKAILFNDMKERYGTIKRVVKEHEAEYDLLRPYEFNSGYFMAFDTNGHSAEELRVHLLNKYGVGTINIMDKTLRLAYCSVENEKIEDIVSIVYKAAGELWS